MNPAAKTATVRDRCFARSANKTEDRMIRLIDQGDDLALHYLWAQPPKQDTTLRSGHALVVGDGGFRRRIPVPSRVFDQYFSA